jgi:GT2 family glycosyltransferase
VSRSEHPCQANETRVAVVIPVYGRHDMTVEVLADLRLDEADFDVFIVDNGGDFPVERHEAVVLTPRSNLGWARGCNFGITQTFTHGYGAYLLLNNDVRLSRRFISGFQDAHAATKGDLLGPLYDHNWPHQRGQYMLEARGYVGRATEYQVPFIDGTCMLVRRATLERTGLLDSDSWPLHGWGCDKDYALRVRSWGGSVWVTGRSYLNHFARQTAAGIPGFSEVQAERENDLGMEAKWGPRWRDLLYEGFPQTSRSGMAQDRLAASGRLQEEVADTAHGPPRLVRLRNQPSSVPRGDQPDGDRR